jgi:hypothetical protein
MTINQALTEILDETAKALCDLDSDALEALEQRIGALAKSTSTESYEPNNVGLTLAKKRLLEIVLQNCQFNLEVLTRLHARNMRNQWAQ